MDSAVYCGDIGVIGGRQFALPLLSGLRPAVDVDVSTVRVALLPSKVVAHDMLVILPHDLLVLELLVVIDNYEFEVVALSRGWLLRLPHGNIGMVDGPIVVFYGQEVGESRGKESRVDVRRHGVYLWSLYGLLRFNHLRCSACFKYNRQTEIANPQQL